MTEIHVYELGRQCAGGLVFVRESEEVSDDLKLIGTLSEFVSELEELDEYDEGEWFYSDSETLNYAYSE